MPRPLVILGLDCLAPALVFERWRSQLPTFSRLIAEGLAGPLRSVAPPITVPAWACMMSGRDPGELGLYGFRNRVEGSYDLRVATGRDVRAKRLWERAAESGQRVAALFMPPSSPPTPVRGVSWSCFMHSGTAPVAFPKGRAAELQARHGPYIPDVESFRADDKARVLEELYAMTRQHFAIARDVLREDRPDLFTMVEIGPDRLHHALWADFDEAHPKYRRDGAFQAEGLRYYQELDLQVAALLEELTPDTAVMIVSDHGARPMLGGVRVNELLRRAGWLRLKAPPQEGSPLTSDLVDWPRTRAWALGGYYARVFLNIRGRDPEGCVAPAEVETHLEELCVLLQDAVAPMEVTAHRPGDLYRTVRGLAPELLVFFGDLSYRALGTFAPQGPLITDTNDRGPDGCNHDWDGVFILHGTDLPTGTASHLSLYDVHATALELLALGKPTGVLGRNLSE